MIVRGHVSDVCRVLCDACVRVGTKECEIKAATSYFRNCRNFAIGVKLPVRDIMSSYASNASIN
jgi:hypothetical protein